jgi:hypothetical protein
MPKEHSRKGGSDAPDPWVAGADLYGQIGGLPTAFALIFCSPRYALTELAAAIWQRFGELPVFGCTTAGEIKPFGSLSGGLSGVGFPGDFVVAATLFDVPYHLERD